MLPPVPTLELFHGQKWHVVGYFQERYGIELNFDAAALREIDLWVDHHECFADDLIIGLAFEWGAMVAACLQRELGGKMLMRLGEPCLEVRPDLLAFPCQLVEACLRKQPGCRLHQQLMALSNRLRLQRGNLASGEWTEVAC
ncbi:hypothetical protein [Tuwongella immobilis]|uniref:Uncharacterized protein n=1 Tax=Tuwongella immobilis TaxID=692036 RepID=A0A6C2YKU6_9BACT|nr:hypothetical protein [Tuwongella immobilis]VIP02198.1 unnamed protein product [Tuwongella immobilis]VTS00681.1 unnamed protein product [Tuwongella immobilis]